MDAHPLNRNRAALAAAWRAAAHEVSPRYARMSQARLRERIEQGLDALLAAGEPDETVRSEVFIAGLEALCWWDWPPLLLAKRLEDFRQMEPLDCI